MCVIKMCDLMLLCKLARLMTELRSLDILARGEMIQHNGDFFAVKHLGKARFFKFGDRNRRRHVVAQHQIELCLDEFPGPDGRFSCVRS